MVQAPAACDVSRHDVPLARLEKKFAGQSARSLSVPPSAYAVHFVGPGSPCFVRNWIRPLAASVPYSAAAEGPFTTSTASKSSGLKSFKRDGAWPPPPRLPSALAVLSTRTPSTVAIGSFRSDKLVEPRIPTRDPLPVVPPLCITPTPGTRSLSRSPAFLGSPSCAPLPRSLHPTSLPHPPSP